MEQWNASIKDTVCLDDLATIFKAFRKGFEIEETYWTYRSLYLSSAKQSPDETAAALATRVKDLMAQCKWPDREKEGRHINLYYHITEHFDVKRYIQNETAREGGNLTWEKLVEEAKHQECVGKEYARFQRENGGGGTPSYGDPDSAADAISRGYKKPQQRSWTPSGGKGGQPKQCDQCGKCNGCKGEKGTCPAWGKECGICHGQNHYKVVCRKATQMQGTWGAQPKQGKGTKPSPGKAKAKYYAHSVVLKMVFSWEEGKLCDTDAVQNSVTSEPSVPLSKAAKQDNPVLSGSKPSKAALCTRNVFSCDSIHNMGDGTSDQCQTDTDPSGCLCIMTYILVRAKTTSRTHNIRVKVDPGADTNLMPVHHFRTIFPYLCDSSGQPKEGVLKKAESSFESYSRDNVTVIGQTKIYAKNIQTGKFIKTRIYVIARERDPILLSNAANQLLGLITMLCENKAVPVGRFVASVTREETDGGEVEAYPIPKTGAGAEMTESQDSKPLSQRAITVTKKRNRTKKARPVLPASMDVTSRTTHSESQPSTTERTETNGSQEQNSVTSGETGWQVIVAKPSPFRTKEGGKDGPKGEQIALRYHRESTTGQWLMPRLTSWMARDSSSVGKTPRMWPGLAQWRSCLCAERSQYSMTCRHFNHRQRTIN